MRGYTLVEILIVVAIIAILAAIGFGIYAGMGNTVNCAEQCHPYQPELDDYGNCYCDTENVVPEALKR